MPFDTDRFNRSYKEITGSSCRCVKINAFKSKNSPKQKADFLYEAMSKIEEKIGTDNLKTVMEKCGMECIEDSLLQTAKQIYEKNTSMESFLDELNTNDIGGGHLTLNGTVIDVTYDKCYCGSVKHTKRKFPLIYCYCSTGWFKKLFEEILQKKVKVELIQTIINGADCCRLKIHI
ncbi:hypothetical protein JXL83_10160 [candidate division WOR-3 bacterium]|nr:hypothetical protein [candidate division WOR-3 bacterium]